MAVVSPFRRNTISTEENYCQVESCEKRERRALLRSFCYISRFRQSVMNKLAWKSLTLCRRVILNSDFLSMQAILHCIHARLLMNISDVVTFQRMMFLSQQKILPTSKESKITWITQ